jgi:hypothetical protein
MVRYRVRMEFGYLRPINGGPTVELVAPTHCHDGHRLGPNRVLVRTAPCDCGKGNTGAHTTWTCRVCGDISYADGHTDDSKLHGGPMPLPEPMRIKA